MAKRKCGLWSCSYCYLGSDTRLHCRRDYNVRVEEDDPCRLNLEEDPVAEQKKKAYQQSVASGCLIPITIFAVIVIASILLLSLL